MGGVKGMKAVRACLLVFLAAAAGGCSNPFFMNVEVMLQFSEYGLHYVKSYDLNAHSPVGVAVDSSGSVYVVDEIEGVFVFNPDGSLLQQWSYTDGEDIAVDNLGHVFILNAASSLVSRFDIDGSGQMDFGSPGSGNGQLDVPLAIACDAAGNVYVQEQDNSRVSIFDGNGVFQSAFGSAGAAPGQFFPGGSGVAVNAAGEIYVADLDRIQKFTAGGAYISGFPTNIAFGNDAYWPAYIEGIAVDTSGNVYVATVNFLCRYAPDGSASGYWGPWQTTATTTFPNCQAVAVGNGGDIYFTDINLGQVLEYAP